MLEDECIGTIKRNHIFSVALDIKCRPPTSTCKDKKIRQHSNGGGDPWHGVLPEQLKFSSL